MMPFFLPIFKTSYLKPNNLVIFPLFLTIFVLNPNKLLHVKQEGELKYKLYFELSHARTLMVIVSLHERIKVITPKIINNKMQKGMWSKWKK